MKARKTYKAFRRAIQNIARTMLPFTRYTGGWRFLPPDFLRSNSSAPKHIVVTVNMSRNTASITEVDNRLARKYFMMPLSPLRQQRDNQQIDNQLPYISA